MPFMGLIAALFVGEYIFGKGHDDFEDLTNYRTEWWEKLDGYYRPASNPDY